MMSGTIIPANNNWIGTATLYNGTAGNNVYGSVSWAPVRIGWRRARQMERSMRRALASSRTKAAVFNRILTRLPVRRGLAVFESHLGLHYSDNPKYIYRELRRSGRPVEAVWSYATSAKGFPSDARLVRRDSWRYHLALARAEFWIDNQGYPDRLRKRPETTYIQTWHGSAYKLMGLDQPRMKSGPASARARLARMVDRFDCFLVRSGHDVDTLVKGLGVRAELLPAGYPRNDPLVNGLAGDAELAAEVAALRRSLDLDDGRRAVLAFARPAIDSDTATGTARNLCRLPGKEGSRSGRRSVVQGFAAKAWRFGPHPYRFGNGVVTAAGTRRRGAAACGHGPQVNGAALRAPGTAHEYGIAPAQGIPRSGDARDACRLDGRGGPRERPGRPAAPWNRIPAMASDPVTRATRRW